MVNDNFQIINQTGLCENHRVPEDIARIYLRLVPLRLMGMDEKTAIKLACQMEAATGEGSAQ
jgi:hypothetical protein